MHWSAALIGQHVALANAAFAVIQLLIALAILWRRTTRLGLALSVPWALSVWWLGEGLGGVLTSGPSAVTGAPGAVILYALLAVLLWPVPDGPHGGSLAAASPVGPGRGPAGLGGAVGQPGLRHLLAASRAGLAARGVRPGCRRAGLAGGHRPGAGRQLGAHGAAVSAVLAVAFAVIAMAVFIPVAGPAGAGRGRRAGAG